MGGFSKRAVLRMVIVVAAFAALTMHPAGAYPAEVTRFAGLDCRWDECPLDEGDGGQANRAVLVGPAGGAFDANGNFYVAQAGRGAIRKVDPSGVISTLTTGLRIATWRDGSGSGVATGPDGSVYVATMDGLVVKVDPSNGSQQIIAGQPSGDDACSPLPASIRPALSVRLCTLQGIAVDAQGNVYVVAARTSQVLMIDGFGAIRAVAGYGTWDWCRKTNHAGDGGAAVGGSLCRPSAIVLEPGGGMLISDTGNHVVRRVDPTGTIRTVAGVSAGATLRPEPIRPTCYAAVGYEETITGVPLCAPSGLASDGLGGFYVTDPPVGRIWHVTAAGAMRPLPVTREGSPADRFFPEWDGQVTGIEMPTNLTLDPAGNLYIVDSGWTTYGRVFKVEAAAI